MTTTKSTQCRLCAETSTSSFPIFSLRNGRLISDIITIICPIKIDISDNFPKSICSKCLDVVTQAIQLREKSIESEEKFRNGFEKVQIKVETDPFKDAVWFDNNIEEENESIEEEQQQHEIINYLPKVKQNNSKVTCHLCGFVLSHATNLRRHILRCHDESLEFPCEKCTCRFRNQIRLNTHLEKVHNEDYNKRFEIRKHSNPQTAVVVPEQESDVNKTFSCYQCDKTFTFKQNLNRHLKKIHLNIKPKGKSLNIKNETDKCKYCEENFNGKKFKYEQHLIEFHSDKFQQIYSCDICPKKFVFLTSLKIHIEVHKIQKR